MQARDIMTDRLASVRPDASVEDAIATMLLDRISGLPVIDDQGHLAGIVTEGDLLRRSEIGTQIRRSRLMGFILGPGRLAEDYVRASGRRVEDVMTADVRTADETTPLDGIVELMLQHHIKRVPIVRDGRMVGIVTRADILRALKSRLEKEAPANALDDAGIAAAIRTAFEQSDCIPRGLVDVTVSQGEVGLHGCITDERERAAIKVAIEGVAGVRSVHDHLAWVEPMSGTVVPSPEDLADQRRKSATP